MLDPDTRTLYTEALCPPPGYVFDEGLAATFTLDPAALLTVPLHIALQHAGNPTELAKDSVALLESLRRVSSSLTVYCDAGHIQVPSSTNVLYSLLEPVVFEVAAPRGGVFHPKFWILRFRPADDSPTNPILRAIVLSRNLTFDRSWDVCLKLEGAPTGRNKAANREFAELIAKLPDLTMSEIPDDRRLQAERLADEVRRAEWELPPGFNECATYAIGLGPRPWKPWECKNLLVVSPFCSGAALDILADSASGTRTLISRPDQLDALPARVLERFACFCLHEAAETEDGEGEAAEGTLQPEAAKVTASGLHAKVLIAEKGWSTWVTVGSANATDPAILNCTNVELLVELTGKTSATKGIDRFQGPDGFGDLLQMYSPNPTPKPVDLEAQASKEAQRILEACRRSLATSGMNLDVASSGAPEEYELILTPSRSPDLSMISDIRVWPITVPQTAAVDGSGLWDGNSVRLPAKALSSMCGFIAFQLTSREVRNLKQPQVLQFVLNVQIRNLPPGRDSAIVRTVIRNREGFLRYLLLLLGDLEDFSPLNPLGQILKQFGFRGAAGASLDELPLLEHLVRAYSRDLEKLKSIKSLVEDLRSSEEGKHLVPLDFEEVWGIFDKLLSGPPDQSDVKTKMEEVQGA